MKNWLLLFTLSLGLLGPACGRKQPDLFEDTGRKIDRGFHNAGEKVDQGLDKAGDKVKDATY